MSVVITKKTIENNVKKISYVLKIYSYLDKVVQLTENKDKAMVFNSKSQAEWFINYMKLKNFNIKTKWRTL